MKLQTNYKVEEGMEEEAELVLKNECKRLLKNQRHETRVQAVRDYYAKLGISKTKAECRVIYPTKDKYMEV